MPRLVDSVLLGVILTLAAGPAGGAGADGLARLDELVAKGEHFAVVSLAREMLGSGTVAPRQVWLVRQRLAVALLAVDRPEEAQVELEAALADAPDDPALHLNLGRALWRLDRRGRAIAEYGRAVELAPEQHAWRLEYADALLGLGIHRDALREVHLARRICGDCLEALRAEVNIHLDRGDAAGGLGALRLLHDRRPTPQIRGLLAAALWASEQPREVAALLDTVPAGHLTGGEILLLIQADRRLKHADRALAWTRQDLPTPADGWDPTAEFWGIVAEICLEAGQAGEALEAIDRALELRPQAALFWNNRAAALLQLGRQEAAAAALDSARRFHRQGGP